MENQLSEKDLWLSVVHGWLDARNKISVLIQWITSYSMPFVLDDPTNEEEVGQLAVDLGNGAVRGKANEAAQVPLTGCLVTANFDLSAVLIHYSRLAIIKMVRSGEKEVGAARRLEQKARDASAALPLLLKEISTISGEGIDEVTRYLQEEVSADVRILEGYSLPLTVANKVLEVAGRLDLREDLQNYIEYIILPYMKDSQPQTTLVEKTIKGLLDLSMNELQTNIEIREDVRIPKQFLAENVEKEDEFFLHLSRVGGKPSKVCRFKGASVRVTVIPRTVISDTLLGKLTQALTMNQEETMDTNDSRIEEDVVILLERNPDNADLRVPEAPDVADVQNEQTRQVRRSARRLRSSRSLRERLRSCK